MSDLPKGWAVSVLGLIASWGSGGTPSRNKPNYYGGGIPWIKTGELGQRLIITTNETISQEGLNNSSAKLFPAGSVAMAMYGATIGKTSILGIEATTNQACAVGIPNKKLTSKEYLYYYLCSQKDAFVEAGKGGAQPNISQSMIKEWEVPLPPLNEQKRITDKLDALLARVDACRERLDRIPTILKRFRQAVLIAATSGKLTAEWRDAVDTPLVKIKDGLSLFNLPESWIWSSIGAVSEVKGGKRLPKGAKLVPEDTGFPYIKAGQLKKGSVQGEAQEYLTPHIQEKIKKYIVSSGDVYITIVGACIGGAGIIPPEYDKANLTENAAKLCNLNSVLNTYLAFWLQSLAAQNHIEFLVKSGAQGKLALMRIKEIPIPLPSIDEQAEIIRRVETLFAYADRIEARYTAARTQVEKLTPALLAKAFRGELVPQDPNDEPASMLLERIRAVAPASTKRNNRKTVNSATGS
jgi:type I restriction enzyme S subunit